MRKGLTMICAALLASGLAACKGGGGNSDEDRLNAAANALNLDNSVYDTSADDASLNLAPGDEGAPANGAAANAAAPAGNLAAPGNATGNRQ